MDHIKDQLRALGVGQHATTSGVAVTVTAPPRRFNFDKASALLTPEQQAVCVAPAAAKVKSQLSGVIVESYMEPGTGITIVRVG